MGDTFKAGEFYDSVYSQDTSAGDAHGWIQWKGTDACVDLHCKCGHLGHVDADFFYFYRCPECDRKYALGQTVALIELTDEQAGRVRQRSLGFKTDTSNPEGNGGDQTS